MVKIRSEIDQIWNEMIMDLSDVVWVGLIWIYQFWYELGMELVWHGSDWDLLFVDWDNLGFIKYEAISVIR